jgi:hypothetical protein
LIAGTGLAAVGVVEFMLGVSDHNQIKDAESSAGGGVASLTLAQAKSLADSGTKKKTTGVVLGASGLGLVALSSALWLMDSGGPAPGTDVSVAMGNGAGAILVGGRF